jgi:hypothetical protein
MLLKMFEEVTKENVLLTEKIFRRRNPKYILATKLENYLNA